MLTINSNKNTISKSNTGKINFNGSAPLKFIFENKNTTTALRLLDKNVVNSLLFVNFTCLVIPRIYIDSKRNKYAGGETAFYELYSIFTNFLVPGLIGLGAAFVLGKINNKFKINTLHWVGNKTIENLADVYKKSIYPDGNRGKTLDKFLENVLRGLKSNNFHSDQFLEENLISKNIEKLRILVQKNKPDKKLISEITESVAKGLGTFDNIKINGKGIGNPSKFFKNLYQTVRQFQKSHNGPAEIVTVNISQIVKKLMTCE